MKGFQFKVMMPKDIVGVLTMIGVHPVTPEQIDRPTGEFALSIYQHLAEFAYDMDCQQIRAAQLPGTQFQEIYEDAMDVLTIFKLSKQLALINNVEDFNFKDLWEPNSKRFRALLSGIINFCRYKQNRIGIIHGMKETVHALDNTRLGLVDQADKVIQQVRIASERHQAELPDMWQAEQEASKAKATVDKLMKQKASADRVVEEEEAKLANIKDRVVQAQQRVEQLREQVAGLQDQIAESPEGLEKEIVELQLGIRQQKSWLEERGSERRARAQRDQVLARLVSHAERYREELQAVQDAAAAARAAANRTTIAKEELAAVKSSFLVRRSEEAELEQACRQVTADIERAKLSHQEKTEQLKHRHQQALIQLEELQAKQLDEQRQLRLLQSQRQELEAEVASVRRVHEAEMNELRRQQKDLLERSEAYAQSVESLMLQHGWADQGMCGSAPRYPSGSPDGGASKSKLPLSSPSPARVAAERRLLLSPIA